MIKWWKFLEFVGNVYLNSERLTDMVHSSVSHECIDTSFIYIFDGRSDVSTHHSCDIGNE